MNPEIFYPELKNMKSSEIFIQWAVIVRDFTVDKRIHIRRIIPKKEQNALIKALKQEYGVGKPDELDKDPDKFERVELITIEREQ